MSEAPPQHAHVVIGHPEHDHLRIRVIGRMHPNADDYWDGNWLMTPLEVVVGAFRGSVSASLRADELQGFLNALKHLDDTMRGEAELSSMEEWLTLRVSVDRVGHLDVAGEMTDRPGVGNTLRFHIGDLDQSHLRTIIDALEVAMASFPVVGSR